MVNVTINLSFNHLQKTINLSTKANSVVMELLKQLIIKNEFNQVPHNDLTYFLNIKKMIMTKQNLKKSLSLMPNMYSGSDTIYKIKHAKK